MLLWFDISTAHSCETSQMFITSSLLGDNDYLAILFNTCKINFHLPILSMVVEVTNKIPSI